MKQRSTGLYHLLFLAALVLLYFWRLVTPLARDRAIFVESDFNLQFYPWLSFVYEQWRQGHIPLWNPYINAGQPGLADIQLAALYPVNLLVYALLALLRQPFTPLALVLIILLHFWLAAVFTYVLIHYLTRSSLAALVGAIVYAFSGYMVTYASIQLSVLQTATWLPLMLYAAHKTATRGHRRDIITLAALIAVNLLAGHPQLFVYNAYAMLVYFLTVTFSRAGLKVAVIRAARRLGPAFLLAVGLAAAQILPTLELFAHSHRAEQLNFRYVSAGLLPDQWLAFMVPAAFGDPLFYVSTTALALAVVALAREGRRTLPWGVLGGLTLLLIMGRHTFAFVAAYVLLPGLGLFRDQYRATYVAVFSVAVLAGWGAHTFVALPRPTGERVRVWVGRAAALVALVGLMIHIAHGIWPESPQLAALSRAWAWPMIGLVGLWGISTLRERGKIPLQGVHALLLALLALDLFSPVWFRPLRDMPPEGIFPATPVVRAMQRDPARPFRISSEGLLPGGPNSAIVFGLEDILGYTPLRLDLMARMDEVPEIRRWGLLNVRYILTTRDFSGDGRFGLVVEEGEKRLYRFGGHDALPRVYLVHEVTLTSEGDVWGKLATIDARRTVLLNVVPPVLLAEPQGPERVNIVRYEPTRMVVEVEAASPGILVFSEVDYPGWRAYVDGLPTPIYRANGALRAIALDAGAHRVEMVYRPLTFYVGAAITLMTLFMCAWMWWRT